MALVVLPIYGRQTRRRSPKVKTGCKTCKIRRVKCDEAKPSCFRCTSTGRKCDGYPSTSDDFQVQVWSHHRPVSSPGNAVSAFVGFGDTVHYLEFYHRYARPMLSSYFDKDFWSRIALQMAHSEPAVRHALIALGSLCQTETGSMKHARAKTTVYNEQKVVLTHYTKSVRSLVERMAEPTYSPEIGLVTCLLFVCIEFLRGNYHTAFTHMRNGLSIISERRQKQRDGSTYTPVVQKSRQDTPFLRTYSLDMSLEFAERDYTVGPHPVTLREIPRPSYAATAIIEDKLIPIFIRGISSALMYGVDAEENLDVLSPYPSLLEKQSFFSLTEAEEACYELRNSSILHVRDMSRKFLLQESADTGDRKCRADLLVCHRSYLEKLELFERQNKLTKEEQIAIASLKVSYYCTFIYLSCSLEVRQTPFDAHLDNFQEILSLCRFILDSQAPTNPQAAHFTFEMSVIPPLGFVATRCRCPTTRREAVALLERNPRREGLWDAQQQLLLCRRVIEMEETRVDPVTGWALEETRLSSAVVAADMDRNGGFWVSFLPAHWVGKEFGPNGMQKLLQEFFHV